MPGDTSAQRIYGQWLKQDLVGEAIEFEALCRRHPGEVNEIRRLHAESRRLRELIESSEEPEAEESGELQVSLAPEGDGTAYASELVGKLQAADRLKQRYEIRDELARGGQGAVLEVWDSELRRRLAMKMVLDEPDSKGTTGSPNLRSRSLGRFLEEAQVTGQLDHPNIVPVHELGIDSGGHVFFTMKLVRGRDLREIFELLKEKKEGWSRARALGVMLKVCEAMSYAHAKGVIHRDLKPANVMVGRFGEVYVMDWGLARVLGRKERVPDAPRSLATVEIRSERREQAGDSDSLVTADGDVLGTPAYMSPEQARGEHDDMGPRSDVYSLGAMLYHLLTFQPPYVPLGAQLDHRFLWMQVQAGPPRKIIELAPDVPGELIAITEKAMAREAADRYADVGELAEDLRAFLEHRVVRAYGTGALPELRKWVERNKVMAAAAGVVVALAIGGLFAANRVQAGWNQRLQRQIAIAEAVNGFLNTDLLAAAEPSAETGRGRELRRILDVAANGLAADAGRFADQPLVEASIRLTLGCTYHKLGEYDAAEEHLTRALELRRATLGSDHDDALLAARALGRLYMDQTRYADAAPILRETYESNERLHGPDADVTLDSLVDIGSLHDALDEQEEAEVAYRRALAGRRELYGPEHPETLGALNALAGLLKKNSRYAEAESMFAQVLEGRRRVYGPEHLETLRAMHTLGSMYRDLGRPDDARPLLEEVHEARERVLGEEHPNTLDAKHDLALLHKDAGRAADAVRLLREVLEIQERVLGDDHLSTLSVRNSLAGALHALNEDQEAAGLWSGCVDAYERLLGPEHTKTLRTQGNLALALQALDRWDEAEDLYYSVWETETRVLGPEHRETLRSTANLAGFLNDKGQAADAERIWLEALDGIERVLGPEHPDTLNVKLGLVNLYREQDRTEEQLDVSLDCLEITLRVKDRAHENVLPLFQNVIECYEALGRTEELLATRVRRLEVLEETLGANDPETLDEMNLIAWEILTGAAHEDLDRALGLARTVDERAGGGNPFYADTLSLALEKTGDLTGALEAQRRAVAAIDDGIAPDVREDMRQRLADLEAGIDAVREE